MLDITKMVQDAAAKLMGRRALEQTEFLKAACANPETHGIVLIQHTEARCLIETMILVPREELSKQTIDIERLRLTCPCRTIRVPIIVGD